MVTKRQSPRRPETATLPLYGFQPPVGTPYGLEVTTIEDFHADHDDWPWSPPKPARATFHYLILVTEGVLRHDVDHVTRVVTPGQWLWVRAGNVLCWHGPGTARGPFVLFEPELIRPDIAGLLAPLTAPDAPTVLTPHPDDISWLEQTTLQLLDEHRALGRRRLEVHHALRRGLLEALLLRLAHSSGSRLSPSDSAGPADRPLTHDRFIDALELHFRDLHRAEDYSQLLGCSVRTLTRAVQVATGKGTRELINDRRMLEARRLLGHAQWTAHSVATHLGFTDAANFGRVFRRHTGITPAAYKARRPTS